MAKDRTKYKAAMRQGLAANMEKKWKEAVSAFRVAINEQPTEPAAYAGLGDACLGLKQLSRALDCFKRAAKYSKGDLNYLKKVADIQERMGMLGDAGNTYSAIGELALRRRQLDEAISNWQRAVRLEASLLGAHRRLAMVYQRQNKTTAAVREYLAIARILQMRGENKKALQMCQAAQRLDPDNPDVETAVELITLGAEAFEIEDDEDDIIESAPAAEPKEDSIADAVRHMASIFAEDTQAYRAQQAELEQTSPLESMKQLAQEQLAEEIFRDEDEEDDSASLSKLERDALLGQGMDYQARGQLNEAITCYRQAIEGGLTLPAAHFTLGMLYLENGQSTEASEALARAAKDEKYAEATSLAIN